MQSDKSHISYPFFVSSMEIRTIRAYMSKKDNKNIFFVKRNEKNIKKIGVKINDKKEGEGM